MQRQSVDEVAHRVDDQRPPWRSQHACIKCARHTRVRNRARERGLGEQFAGGTLGDGIDELDGDQRLHRWHRERGIPREKHGAIGAGAERSQEFVPGKEPLHRTERVRRRSARSHAVRFGGERREQRTHAHRLARIRSPLPRVGGVRCGAFGAGGIAILADEPLLERFRGDSEVECIAPLRPMYGEFGAKPIAAMHREAGGRHEHADRRGRFGAWREAPREVPGRRHLGELDHESLARVANRLAERRRSGRG